MTHVTSQPGTVRTGTVQPDNVASQQDPSATRRIVYRSRGATHGPITRLMSPGDLGQLLKPFVFLDLFRTDSPASTGRLPMHPHSGIATLTFVTRGAVSYEDSTGAEGVLPTGGVEWMRAGNAVWHTGGPAGDSPLTGFQLWVALPPALENGPTESLHLAPDELPRAGPVRVLLGRYGDLLSPIPAPSDLTYLAVRLRDGEAWRYQPPAEHTLAWLAVSEGELSTGDTVGAGELAMFKDGNGAIDVVARGETAFVVGSAVRHPHDLVTGYYSVHTHADALAQGEAAIARLGATLRQQGRR